MRKSSNFAEKRHECPAAYRKSLSGSGMGKPSQHRSTEETYTHDIESSTGYSEK